jgi:hypothetical protein
MLVGNLLFIPSLRMFLGISFWNYLQSHFISHQRNQLFTSFRKHLSESCIVLGTVWVETDDVIIEGSTGKECEQIHVFKKAPGCVNGEQ